MIEPEARRRRRAPSDLYGFNGAGSMIEPEVSLLACRDTTSTGFNGAGSMIEPEAVIAFPNPTEETWLQWGRLDDRAGGMTNPSYTKLRKASMGPAR